MQFLIWVGSVRFDLRGSLKSAFFKRRNNRNHNPQNRQESTRIYFMFLFIILNKCSTTLKNESQSFISTLHLLERTAVDSQSFFSCLIVINYWPWVLDPLLYVGVANFAPVVDVLGRQTLQLRQPLLYIGTLRVVVGLLGPRVKDPEIGLGVGAVAHCPLPPPRILHRAVIHQFGGKVLFSLVPIKEEVFGEEGSHNHPAPVVHEPRGVEFPHGCVDDGEASSALLPGRQLRRIVFPLHLVEFALEGVGGWEQDPRKVVSDVGIEISPVQFVNDVVRLSQLAKHSVVDLPGGDGSEMQVGGKASGGYRGPVSILVVIFKLGNLTEDLQPFLPASHHPNLLVEFEQSRHLLRLEVEFAGLQGGSDFQVLALELEVVRFSDCEGRQAVVFERGEHQIGFLALRRKSLTSQQRVEQVIFFSTDLDAFLLPPLLDLLVPGLRKGGVVVVEVNRSYFVFLMDLLQDLKIITVEEVKLALEAGNILFEFFEAVDHELHTVVGKVGVLLWLDLRGVEDEDRSDFLVPQHLLYQRGVVDQSEVPVEKEQIHQLIKVLPALRCKQSYQKKYKINWKSQDALRFIIDGERRQGNRPNCHFR